ncbi:hypothetical protein [Sphingomonas sp. PAMC 26621]|uniref:hypothetical protein n=1 Tax=Sphingomonas sp. PAMC 26621 TaxID=1112213 RepID=UPI000289D404|nr:hypothetical protein [Sphingomonas sp. PAMC 26621]
MSAFGQSKPLASLSSTLLARKGQAKPAMRPQGFGGFGSMSNSQDDLGWNDMGPAETAAPPVPPPAAVVPPVIVQREALREELETSVEATAPAPRTARVIKLKPVSLATATRIGRETRQKHSPKGSGRTAFTLRLDQDRHLRLRLASALQNASAQVLVTEALDQFLQTLPEVEALVAQLPTPTKRVK